MELQVGDRRAVGALVSFAGAEISFFTDAWLSPADQVPAFFSREDDAHTVRAEVMIRALDPQQDRNEILYTALLVQIEPAAQEVLETWILADLAPSLNDAVDPYFEGEQDPDRVTVRWRAPERFLESWENEISKGFLEIPDEVNVYSERVQLRLLLPDGQTLALTTRLEAVAGEYRLRFRLALSTRQKLRRVARWCEDG